MPRDSFLSFRPLRTIRAPMNFQEWWLILLPAIFGFGWIAARVDMRHVVRQSRRLPRGYLRGLNHLLKDEEDKAIDAFLEVLDLEPEIIEVHFALGALFRRRGDIERAIRIHKTLSERDDLPRPTREEALFELARDYFKSGFWDRAEKLFEACAKRDSPSSRFRIFFQSASASANGKEPSPSPNKWTKHPSKSSGATSPNFTAIGRRICPPTPTIRSAKICWRAR